jgi:hypothetical protein
MTIIVKSLRWQLMPVYVLWSVRLKHPESFLRDARRSSPVACVNVHGARRCHVFVTHWWWYLGAVTDRSFVRLTYDIYKSVEITNNMQPCNRIYYSKVYWRLNMFLAAHRSSSGALNCICSLWFTYTCGDRPVLSVPSYTFYDSPSENLHKFCDSILQ